MFWLLAQFDKKKYILLSFYKVLFQPYRFPSNSITFVVVFSFYHRWYMRMFFFHEFNINLMISVCRCHGGPIGLTIYSHYKYILYIMGPYVVCACNAMCMIMRACILGMYIVYVVIIRLCIKRWYILFYFVYIKRHIIMI